jgi:geranylgeranyl diphosphate synthase type II
MDDDDYRRGKRSSHKVFGEATAILAGDALLTAAFELLAETKARQLPAMLRDLSHLAGAPGMVGGQFLDLRRDTEPEQVFLLKTAALFEAAARLGARTAGASEQTLARYAQYGRDLGLAFQYADELMDAQLSRQKARDAEQRATHFAHRAAQAITGATRSATFLRALPLFVVRRAIDPSKHKK